MAASLSSKAVSHQNKWQTQMMKQTTNPGDGKILIYDPKGKTCHQCRHKAKRFAACKNQRKNKLCPLLYCHQCLLNRYGEKTEEVEVLEEWSCPRCRGICNCSSCMIKRGESPTGRLCNITKAAGYSSVSEFLHVNGRENLGLVKNAQDADASLRKRGASKMEIGAPRKKGRENLFGRVAGNVIPESSTLKETVVTEGTVHHVQPLTGHPLYQFTMEGMNYPSKDVIEEVDEAADDVTMEDHSIFKDHGIGITLDENSEFIRKIGEEANKKQTDDLVALRNDVAKLTNKITGIDKKVNLLQQSHDSCRVTQLHMGISKQPHIYGDTHCPSGFEGSKRLQDKSLGKLQDLANQRL